jgi:hypothetical protein
VACDPRWEKAFAKQRSSKHLRAYDGSLGGAPPSLRTSGEARLEPSTPTSDQVRAAMREAQVAVAACSGAVATADFELVGATGKARSVRVRGVDATAASCIRKALRRIRVPKFEAKTFRVSVPFKLRG